MTTTAKRLRTADAKNRSLRVFLEGLAFAVLTAVALVVYPVFTSAHSWDDLHWSLLLFSVVQAIITSGFAYILRTKLDPSKIPTPLPPGDPGPPQDQAGVVDYGTIGFVLIVLTFVGVVLLLFRQHLGG